MFNWQWVKTTNLHKYATNHRAAPLQQLVVHVTVSLVIMNA